MPRREDGTYPSIQVRESERHYATPLDAFLARTDDAAHEYLADCLTFEREIDLGAAPSAESAKNRSSSRPKARRLACAFP